MLLSLKNLRKERLETATSGYALTIGELNINAGDKIILTGPSGSGKSTILDILGLVLKPDSGDEFFLNLSGTHFDLLNVWSRNQLEELAKVRRKLGYVLQTGALLPYLSARQNILVSLQMEANADKNFLAELADRLGITRLLDKLPAQLSVGERQRVAIARAIIKKPLLILADEPTAALDPTHAAIVMDLFTSMVDSLQLTLVLVTHDVKRQYANFRHFTIEQSLSSHGQLVEAHLREMP